MRYKKSEPVAQQPTPVDETSNLKTYTNTKYGFELQYPKDFMLKNKTDGMSLSSGQECNPILDGSLGGGEWPNNCITYDLLIQKNKITGMEESKTVTQVAGYQAERTILPDGMFDHMEQVYVQFYKDQNWYISYVTYNVSQRSSANDVLNKLLSTFKFAK